MDLHTWLDAQKGRAQWLAGELGVSKTAVSLWRDNGVPLGYMQRIVTLSGDAVTIEAMTLHAIACRQGNEAKRVAEAKAC